MPPALLRLPAAHTLLLAALIGLHGCGGTTRPEPRRPLFDGSPTVDVLLEEGTLGGPRSGRPNRFARGWIPTEADGRQGFRAGSGTPSLVVTTLSPRERRLLLDLAIPADVATPGHLRARWNGGPTVQVPFADPLSIPVPADLPPGRHEVELSSRDGSVPPLVALGGAVRPAGASGVATVRAGDLHVTGPAIVDVVLDPDDGSALRGDVCPAGAFASTRGMSLSVVTAEGRETAAWSGGDGVLDRFRGCRSVELPAIRGEGPVRVRFRVLEAGSAAEWRGWHRPPRRGEPREAKSGLADAPRPAHPESPPPPRLVVLYVMDALRADAVGHLGGPAAVSPTLDRLAREGFTFRSHRSTAPNTLLSIRHLFTGTMLVDGSAWRSLSGSYPTLAQVYQEAGYRTGLFSGNGYVSARFGLARGFDHVSKEALFRGSPDEAAGVNRSAEHVHAAALDWLGSLPADAPAFLYLHTIHPHNPYAPPPDLEERFTAGIPSAISGDTRTLRNLMRGRRSASPADRRRLEGLYLASVSYNDRELARFLAELAARVPPEDTLVVVTSDHGEELFDHGGVLHGYTLYEELLRIPLVVWAPGRIRPGESGEITDALDLHATLVSLAGDGESEGPARSEGRSLLGLLAGRDGRLAPRLHVSASEGIPGGMFAVRSGSWKYIWARGTERTWAMGLGPARSWDHEYLFDLAADPGETRNLAGAYRVREQWLAGRLRAWVEAQLARAPLGDGPAPEEEPLDEEERRRLRALGYLD